MDVIDDQSY